MAEAIIDGLGDAYKAAVTENNELKVSNTTAMLGEQPNGTLEGVRINTDNKLDIASEDLFNVFNQILIELKKVNLHLAKMNDQVLLDCNV